MRTYKIGTILIVALCLPVTGALANSVPDGIGVYHDTGATTTRIDYIPPDVPFTAYLVATNISCQSGILGWEMQIKPSNPSVYITDVTINGTGLNVTTPPTYEVGLVTPLPFASTMLLATITGLATGQGGIILDPVHNDSYYGVDYPLYAAGDDPNTLVNFNYAHGGYGAPSFFIGDETPFDREPSTFANPAGTRVYDVPVGGPSSEGMDVTTDHVGNSFIVWGRAVPATTEAADIYAQKLDPMGVPVWQFNGILIRDWEFHWPLNKFLFNPLIIDDAVGGAFIAYLSGRSRSEPFLNCRLWLTHVDADGNVAEPRSVSGVPGPTSIELTRTGNAGVVLHTTGYDIVFWFSPDLVMKWDVHVDRDFPRQEMRTIEVAHLTWLAVYHGQQDGVEGVYAQKILTDGSLVFMDEQERYAGRQVISLAKSNAEDGEKIESGSTSSLPRKLATCSDGNGGAFIAIAPDGGNTILIQRFDAADNIWATPTSVDIGSQVADSINLNRDGSGGCFLSFSLDRRDIYVEHIDANGFVTYGGSGKLLPASSDLDEIAVGVSAAEDRHGHVHLFWNEQRLDSSLRLMGAEVDGALNITKTEISSPLPGPAASPVAVAPRDGTTFTITASVLGDDGLDVVAFCGPTYNEQLIHTSSPPDFARRAHSFPNPFNPACQIEYSILRCGVVHVEIYDVAGRRICDLFPGNQDAGVHRISWSGVGDDGRRVSSGFYLAVISLDGSRVASTRMVMVK